MLETLAELEKILRTLARLRARLARVNTHKLPVYWSLQPRVFQALKALESALQTDTEMLLALQQNPQKFK